MRKWLKEKLAALKAYWSASEFDYAYNKTAGELLRGDEDVVSMIDRVNLFDQTPYDKGVVAALGDFNKLLNEEVAT